MIDNSEQEAAQAMMQLYLSPFSSVSLRPTPQISASMPPFELTPVTSSRPQMDMEPMNNLIKALEENAPPRSQKGTSFSKQRARARTSPSMTPLSPALQFSALPRLRSHATRNRQRRNSLTDALQGNRRKTHSVDSDVGMSLSSSDTERRGYESVVVGQDGQKRIGAYTIEERTELVRKYLLKRKKREWKKKIKYTVRKTFADSRLRVKGRFISKENEAQLREALLIAM